jgi:hypothetical protein
MTISRKTITNDRLRHVATIKTMGQVSGTYNGKLVLKADYLRAFDPS